ncbi:hypothetical protein PPMP20_29345 [Paraburkholderia phymatum]|uniref:hypothetical protein n=1 Tax=Paraburkholderia phymatum TaxID=148447 RepID=UPI0012FD6434|nr:hypothetical protein [Paraburkholderia phymatum]
MKIKPIRLPVTAIAALAFIAIAVDIFNSPFYADKEALRYVVSIVGAAFALLCIAGAVYVVGAMYWFLRMLNSPKEGLTILDSGMFKGRAVFSSVYLSPLGLEARSRLLVASRRFLECWLGAVLLAAIMYYVIKR